MKNLRVLARVVTYDKNMGKILLVKNKGMSFWYAPGGGWEHERENILECAKREVHEETGLHVDIKKMLYVQEYHDPNETVLFEAFWLAEPSHEQSLNENHVDLDPSGNVESAKWFNKEELQDLKVFPKRLKNTFWDNIESIIASEDPFLGVE